MSVLDSFDDISALELIRILNESDEQPRIEAKTSSNMGRSVMETICAYANEPNLGGGYLILGVSRGKSFLFADYEVVGVPDPAKLQEDIATACRTEFNRPLRPRMRTDLVGGRNVVVAFVPELGPGDKPLYFAKDGLPRGAYRRIGPTDQRCTEDDLPVFYSQHQSETYDRQVFPDSDISDIDADMIVKYRLMRSKVKSDAEELGWSDSDLLLSISCARSVGGSIRPTVAGILLLGRRQAIRRCFPMMRIDYVRVPGTEWIEQPENKYETVSIHEPLLAAIGRMSSHILSDLPRTFSFPSGDIQRQESPILPDRVIREILVNAVMHRCYRVHGTVMIIRYNNRIEIRNPGFSLISEDMFGQPTSQTRNPIIAAVLYDVGFAENKGSGLRTVQNLMRTAKLAPPVFESNREANQFIAYLLMHNFLTPEDILWLSKLSHFELSAEQQMALVVCRELGAIDNATYRSINGCDTLAASGNLRKLVEHGLVQAKGNGNKRYYVPDRAMSDSLKLSGGSSLLSGGSSPLSGGFARKAEGSDSAIYAETAGSESPDELPEEVVDLLPKIGKRANRSDMRKAILELCRWRPLMPSEIANYLKRSSVRRLVDDYISPLMSEGLLERTIPDKPAHPAQKYRTTAAGIVTSM